jgi:chromosome segregation ATPase
MVAASELKVANSQIEKLQNDILENSSFVHEMKSLEKKHKKDVRDLQSEVFDLKVELDVKAKELGTEKQSANELYLERERLESLIKHLESNLEDSKYSLIEMAKRKSEAEETSKSASSSTVHHLEKSIHALRVELKQAEQFKDENKRCKKENFSLRTMNEDLEHDVLAKSEEIELLEEEIIVLQEHLKISCMKKILIKF